MASSATPSIRPGHVVVGALVLALLVAAGWSATWTVRQNEQGVVLRFGRVARIVPAGMHFTLPWPVERIVRVQTTEVRTMPIGYKMIDRVQGKPGREEERQWLTGDTNIVEMEATLLFTVEDPVAYLFGAADLPGGRSRNFVLRKIGESVLTELVATMPIDDVLSSGKQELSRRALREVQAAVADLGLGLRPTALNITEVTPPSQVIAAFNDVTTARADRERRTTEARGYERRTIPRARASANKALREAETYADDLENRARGAAEAFRRLELEVRKAPGIARRRIWLSTLERLLPRVRTDVVPPVPEGERRRIYVED